MSRVHVVPAEPFHVEQFADKLRQADRDEIWAARHVLPAQAISEGVRGGQAWAAHIDDEPAAIFGVRPLSLLSGVGVPWMLGTPVIERCPMAFLRPCQDYVEQMQSGYRYLINWVDERNAMAHRWLEWLGFSLGEAMPFGIEQRLFRQFEWGRRDV